MALTGSGLSTESAIFNLGDGSVAYVNTGSASITAVGNGWYRCSYYSTAATQSFFILNFGSSQAQATPGNSYVGSGEYLYLWGAQLAVGPYALDYVPTTSAAVYGPRFDYDGSGVTIVEPVSTNQFLYSEQFDNAWWTKGNASITANATAAPDGTVTADKLIENSSNAFHYVGRISLSVSAQAYTASFYVKAAERTRCFLDFNDGITGATAYFDLSNGTSSNVSALLTVSINSVGNGWYRITASRVYASATGGAQFTISPTIAAGTAIYTGDGTSGIFIWGAQVEVGSTATAYMVSGATNGFRAVPVVSGSATARGLLVEEQRTNLVTYSEDFSNAAWAKARSSIIANATTSPDGTVNADQSTIDNTTGFHDAALVQVSVTSGTVYTISLFAKKNVGIESFYFYTDATSTASIAKFNLNNGAYIGNASGNGYVAFSSYSSQSFGSGWYRFTATFTASATASNRYVVFGMSTNTNDTVTTLAGNGTDNFYLWGAQLEAGSFATSYIPTLASTVTRSADVASVNTLSPWFNASAGTVYAEFDIIGKTPTFGMASQIDDGTLNNRIVNIGQEASGGDVRTGSFIAQSGASEMNEYPVTSMTVGAVYKSALAFATNNCAITVNGASIVDSSVTLPTGLTTTRLGSRISDGYLNGHLRRFAFYPRRLTASELTALTA